MSKEKPNIPKGTRDFGPEDMTKRNYLLSVIQKVFKNYGFQHIETPAMEKLSVLMGKYGDEGDHLLYKVLNSGDFLSKVNDNLLQTDSKSLTPKITEKGLRYDLTVPFARYVVSHRHELTLPFRRYQIQPVWRADRPQKGRYREFVQCDADVIGTDSLVCEAEIILMLTEILETLGVEGYEIAINSRKILSGLAQYVNHPDKELKLCVAIDKLDKIGIDQVLNALVQNGFDETAVNMIEPYLQLDGNNQAKFNELERMIINDKVENGILELQTTLDMVSGMGGNLEIVTFDPTLARGLAYYTGVIFEVRMIDKSIGSISGGGRYDDLTGIFGLEGISGVGISLGIDRIYDVMNSKGLFSEIKVSGTQVLVAHIGAKPFELALQVVAELRSVDIMSEIYPDDDKLKKQFSYANNKHIPFVVTIGEEEVNSGKLSFKDMNTGNQSSLTIQELKDKFT